MIAIELLPAAHGDSLWIEYGAARQRHRILIDGGPAHSYAAGLRKRMAKLTEGQRIFELLVVTHIDADHIDGALILLQDKDSSTGLKFQVKEFWFNGWEQLAKAQADTFAPLQGEFLSGLLTLDAKLKSVWNKRFKQEAVVVTAKDPLPEFELAGGARLTLLGPTETELSRLRARWASAIRDFTPGDAKEAVRRLKERREYRPPATPAVFAAQRYGADRTPANGSSISFMLEHDGVAMLLAGDAHARTLATTLSRLAAQRAVARLRFDAVKLPHHGSMGNVSDEWLRLVDCERWLISTNGAVFGHPDVETVELIARHCSAKPTIYCNYRSETTRRLENSDAWHTVFPGKSKSVGPAGGLLLQLSAAGSSSSARASGAAIGASDSTKPKRSNTRRGSKP
jgi:beta-lactamase superfamily II metal-dependent hydrolase